MSKNEKTSYEELFLEIEKLKKENNQLKKRKRYGLVWEEKTEKFEKESKNALPVLKEKDRKFQDIVDSKNPKSDFNILIEGDNYHSLSVLNYTHRKKIDVIYIDPPYNTGNKDFVYNDHFVDKEDRFRHSKWLSFMSKRLKLAKNLLKDDGVMFISIDDHEQAQLKLLCNEIFGFKNTEQYIWSLLDFEESSFTKTASKTVRIEHEYIMAVYKKNKKLNKYKEYRFKSRKDFKNVDNDPRGDWMSGNISRNGIKTTTGSKYFTITTPTGKKYTRNWTLSQNEYSRLLKDNRIFFSKNGDGVPRLKIFKNEPSYTIQSSIFNGLKTSITGKNQLKSIFNNEIKFDFPKPINLIKRLLEISAEKSCTVLDFMAGSGTTGHAVLDLNKEDGGNRKFILCTNNENKICENITWQRIKKVSEGYKKPNGEKAKGLGGNIKYLKTDFIKINQASDNLKEKVVETSTEILCLKENTFSKVKNSYNKNRIKIFENNDKYTAILFDLFYFDEFIEELKELKGKTVAVYVFSYTKDFSKEEFRDLEIDFSVEAIPEKVLETYKKIFNL